MPKRVLVVGRDSGLGAAIVERLCQQEVETWGTSRRIVEDDAPSWALAVDVRRPEQVENAVGRWREDPQSERWSSIIYCVGYAHPQPLSRVTEEEIQQHLEVNLVGAMHVAQRSIGAMQRGGKLVFIASSSGMQPRPGWSLYGAAKAGLISFAQSIVDEMAPYGIQVYCVCPGRVATPLREVLAPREDPDTIMQSAQVARVVVDMLLSDDGDVLGSYPIRVHGGRW